MTHVKHSADEIAVLATEGACIIAEGYLVQVGQADSGADPKKIWITTSMCPDALVASWKAMKAHPPSQVAETGPSKRNVNYNFLTLTCPVFSLDQ